MVHAGAGKGAPLIVRDAALVTDHQCGDDAGIGRVAERSHYPITYAGARGGNPGNGSGRSCGQQLRQRLLAHIAGCCDAAFQHPGFEIEAMRVVGTVGPLEPNGELPALAGMHGRLGALGSKTTPRGQ